MGIALELHEERDELDLCFVVCLFDFGLPLLWLLFSLLLLVFSSPPLSLLEPPQPSRHPSLAPMESGSGKLGGGGGRGMSVGKPLGSDGNPHISPN